MDKKGQLELLQSGVISLVIIAIVLGVGLTVLYNFSNGLTSNSVAQNATNDTITALGQFSDYFGLIVIVIVAAVVIGLVFTAFLRRTE